MLLPGLTPCGSAIQPARFAWFIGERAGGERTPARDVAEVGRDLPRGGRAGDSVARGAGAGGHIVIAGAGERGAGRRGRRGELGGAPAVEIGLALDGDVERHVGVLHPAKFGALAAIDAGVQRQQGHGVHAARDQVLLAG